MRFNCIFLSVVALSFLFTSCQQDVDKFVPINHVAPGDVADVFAIIQDLEQVHTIDLSDQTVTIELGRSVLTIPSDAFVDEHNEVVRGTIELTIVEVNDQKSMVKYDLSSVDSDQEILDLVSAIRIEAKQSGSPLAINPQSTGIGIHVFDANTSPAVAYTMTSPDDINTWQEAPNNVSSGDMTIVLPGQELDTTGYEVTMLELPWIGLHRVVSVSDYTVMCLKLFDSNTPSNTRAFILYDNVNSCQRLDVSSSLGCSWTTVPVEFEGRIAVFAHKGGDVLEAGSERQVITTNIGEVSIEPIRLPADELIEFVDGL